MKKRIFNLHVNILTALICLSITVVFPAGCTTARKPVPSTPDLPNQTVTVTPGATAAPITPAVTSVPVPQATLDAPPELERMKATAISMVSSIQAKKWTTTENLFSTLKRDWSSYKNKAAKANITGIQIGSFSSDISNLQNQIAARKVYEASLAANRILMSTISLSKLYRTTTPFEIGELEFYIRNILLTSQHGDWVLAKSSADSAVSVWRTVKNRAAAVNEENSAVYSDTLLRLGNYIDKKDTNSIKTYCERLLTRTEALGKDLAK